MFLRKYIVLPLLVCCAVVVLLTGFSLTTETANAQAMQPTACAARLFSGNSYTCFNSQGNATSKGAFAPQSTSCNLEIYDNGPFLATSNWSLCINGSGNFNIPSAYNDQASSWSSCTAGTFYVNSNGGGGSGSFADLSYGNFPLGGVSNDSLSSVYLNYSDSCPFYTSGINHGNEPYPYFYTGDVS